MEEKEGIERMRLEQPLAALLFGLYIISPAFNINFVIFLFPKFLLRSLVSSFFYHISLGVHGQERGNKYSKQILLYTSVWLNFTIL